MARVDYTDIQDALDTTLTSGQITAFIDDANVWVDQNLKGDVVSALLIKIEKYLACHFCTLRDPRLRSAQLDDVDETYQRDTQMTEYLKAAAALDPTGEVEDQFIASKKGRKRFGFRVGAGYDSDLSELPAT